MKLPQLKLVFYKSERWTGSLLQIVTVRGGFMFKKINISRNVINIVSGYAPQSMLSNDLNIEYYDLFSVSSKVNNSGLVILGGNFKGHVGRKGDSQENKRSIFWIW